MHSDKQIINKDKTETDQELKDLVASLAISQKRTDIQIAELAEQQKRTDIQIAELTEQQKKTDAQLAKTDVQLAKTDAQLAKTDAQLAKTSKKIDRLGELIGNMANNQGDIAEEFFYRSFKKNPVLNGVKFNEVTRHLKNRVKGIEDEFDIVLINGDCVAIIEVKAKAHIHDLEKMINKKVINFPLLFNYYQDYKLYAGIATLATNTELITKAQELGLFLITQQGKHAEIVNNGVVLH